MRRASSESKGKAKAPTSTTTASNGFHRWQNLHAVRRGFLTRCEQYASVTIPKVHLPDHVNQNTASIQHDWTSVGAQCVNHLTNKIVGALFQPGMPFFRLDIGTKDLEQTASELGLTADKLRGALVAGEQRAVRLLDQRAIRPILHSLIRQLIVVGNVLLDLSDNEAPRAIALKDYVVKRSLTGRVQEILHHERVLWDELDDKAQAAAPHQRPGEEGYVDYVRWFTRKGNTWRMDISVDGCSLGPAFQKTWKDDSFPIYPLAWDLADKHNYGTGLVEDYAGDFGTLSTLSESEIKAAILISDFRWLANPGGVGDIEEFKTSKTGDVIAGVAGDLNLVAHVSTNALQQLGASSERVINRLGRAFLLGSAVTRDAERVTAEEIRMQAMELESSLGGVYSRLAVDLQVPLSAWLLKQIDVEIAGTNLKPTIVTGLAALSRNVEAQQMMMWLQSLTVLGALDPDIRRRLRLSDVISVFGAQYGIDAGKYVIDEQEAQAQAQAEQEAIAEQEARTAGVTAGAQALAKGE